VRVERWIAPTGKPRLLVHMDEATAARYTRAARLAVPRAMVGPRSYGSARRPDRSPSFGVERRAWRAALVAAAEPGAVAETGDVAACFPSIEEGAIRAAAAAAGGAPEPLLEVLAGVREIGIRGLPIGPAASSYLANAVLSLADSASARAGVLPVRWVDDVVFIGSRGAVSRAGAAWRDALSALGLVHHEGKRWSTPAAPDVVPQAYATASAVQTAAHGIIRS
jgi:hypothetical protein